MKLKILLFTVIGTIFTGSFTHGKTVSCHNTLTSKCLCDASMILDCGHLLGAVRNETKLDHLKLAITSRTGQVRFVTLQNPPGGIRDYYAIERNDWVWANTPDLKPGDQIEVAHKGYGIDEKTPLYKDCKSNSSDWNCGRWLL